MKKKGGGAAQAEPGTGTASKANKLKNNRKDTYEIKAQDDPFLRGLSQSEKEVPQFINLHQFVSSRAHELRHFTKVLKSKLTSKMEI